MENQQGNASQSDRVLINAMSSAFGSLAGGDNLLRAIKTEEMKEREKERVYSECTFGGAVLAHVKYDRVVKTAPLTIPENINQYKIEAKGKVFEPPRRCLMDMWAQAYRRWVYDTSRVRYPLKRVGWEPGGKGKYDNRGIAEFVRISWDEALELVAGEIKRIKEGYGNSAIAYLTHTTHTTWGTIHGMGTEYTVVPRFLNILGGYTEYVPGTSSWAGWVSGAAFMYGYWWANGTSEGVDSFADSLQNSRMVVYWGLDATKSTRMYLGHESEVWRHWVREAGIKTVMVSPEFNDTAVVHADRWVPVYPGSDAALAAAIMYVWVTEGTYDKNYVETHAVGFEKFRDYLLGKDDGVPKTPQWAEKICGVNPETTISLAREWAAGPTTLNCQLGGACRGWNGHEWTRMMVTLQTLQGLGKPGVNMVTWGTISGGAPFDKSVHVPGYSTGINPAANKLYSNPIPQRVHTLNISDCILKPPVKWKGGTTGAAYWWEEFFREYSYPVPGYSEIKMILRMGGGHFASYANVNWRAEAYLSPKVETTVMTALFMEPVMRYADIILPACTDFERNDYSMLGCGGLYIPYSGSANHQIAIYQQKCIEPLGQSMSDMDIFYHLARKMGIEDEFSEGNTEDDWIRKLFEKSTTAKFISYEDFKKKGHYIFPFPEKYEPTPPLRWFYEKGGGLATPSGKIEIYSRTIADFYGENHPEIPPVPKYLEPKDGPKSPQAKQYPLIGFFPHPKFRLHTMMENVSWLRELHKKRTDGREYEPFWINPVDAAARDIKHGDIAIVSSTKGKLLASAFVTERIIPGSIRIFYGAFWEPEDPRTPGSLDRGGSANVLASNEPMSYHAYLHRVEHMMVQVRKWEGQR
ncbi:MAG: molybdopterin-dependent oxidoreductase [Dehalococcoidia bacterium]|nr:molybdopterin-dependent oxidoreductase [Dehalococcoidia bacterium]